MFPDLPAHLFFLDHDVHLMSSNSHRTNSEHSIFLKSIYVFMFTCIMPGPVRLIVVLINRIIMKYAHAHIIKPCASLGVIRYDTIRRH